MTDIVKRLRCQGDDIKELAQEAANEIERLRGEVNRLSVFLGEISAMGPADEEWDANSLEDAVALAKQALEQR